MTKLFLQSFQNKCVIIMHIYCISQKCYCHTIYCIHKNVYKNSNNKIMDYFIQVISPDRRPSCKTPVGWQHPTTEVLFASTVTSLLHILLLIVYFRFKYHVFSHSSLNALRKWHEALRNASIILTEWQMPRIKRCLLLLSDVILWM